MNKKICKICDTEESELLEFHTHHIIPKNIGGTDDPENLIDICNDCHFNIHHPDSIDGNLDDLEDNYKEAIAQNIFSDGYGIIPSKISHDPKISSFAKLLYCDISSLCASKGYCWATNGYFAKVFKVSEKTVSRAILELAPFIVIRNKSSRQRTIWVHQLGAELKPITMTKKGLKLKKELQKKAKPPVKPKPVKKVTIKYTEDDLFLAELLLSKIIYNFPTFENKKVNISEWAEEIRKLREIDKATREQINFMIIWLQGGEVNVPGKPIRKFEPHSFWSKNVMSAGKMRKQWFENLVPQLQDYVKTTIKKSTPTQL